MQRRRERHLVASRELIAKLLFVVSAGLLASHPIWATSILTSACVFVGITLVAGWTLAQHSNHTIARLAIVGTSAALGWAGPQVFSDATPWRPFFAQAPGQEPLLLIRAGLLFALVIATEEDSAKARALWLGTAALLLTASLYSRILFWPYCCVALVAIGLAARRVKRIPSRHEIGLVWATLTLAVAAALVPSRHRTVFTEPQDPQAAVSFWMRHANPYQAHYRALQWARRELVPGEGYLALAHVDIAMARADKARKALTRAAARTESNDIRQRAKALLDELDRQATTGDIP